MRSRRWVPLTLGFGVLLLVIGLSGLALYRSMGRVYAEVAAIQQADRERHHLLNELRSELYTLGIRLRDYLLASPEDAAEQREEVYRLHETMQGHLARLAAFSRIPEADTVGKLRQAVDQYWKSIEPVFEWTPAQRSAQGARFLRHNVRPYRLVAFDVTQRIEELNAAQIQRRQQDVLQTQLDLRAYLRTVTIAALTLGLLVAAGSVLTTIRLENAAERHRLALERGAEQLRGLSHKLVNAQEEERRNISRELHDQVGQMLTALRMELGNVEQLRDCPGPEFAGHLAEAKELAEETLRTVRGMSMGLRPAMLDELGLVPALKWQAREFTQRSGVPVDLQVDGSLDDLPENLRTCVYRVVQEALTNCARHAEAKNVRVTLHGRSDSISLTVQDDGLGFAAEGVLRQGLGLVGIEERVGELGGRVDFFSQPGKGTLVRCDIPIATGVTV
jgi:signal transduction histidine kinase